MDLPNLRGLKTVCILLSTGVNDLTNEGEHIIYLLHKNIVQSLSFFFLHFVIY